MTYVRSLFWFRRDLRLADNAGLCLALQQSRQVFPVFVIDADILAAQPPGAGRRLAFLGQCLVSLQQDLRLRGSDLWIAQGTAPAMLTHLAGQLGANAVFCNEDYEPQAIARDNTVAATLANHGIAFHRSKDQVIFARDELLTQAGKPYTVFTPYARAWRRQLETRHTAMAPSANRLSQLAPSPAEPFPLSVLDALGVAGSPFYTDQDTVPLCAGETGARAALADFRQRLSRYHETRDFPAVRGVSYLSAHNRFGTVSIRELVRTALTHPSAGADSWLNELVWRDFYMQVLYHFPHCTHSAFKAQYADLPWPNDPALFTAWCDGRTGYPLVDAAMRQLNQSGYMHNRLRMVVASFLTKDLLVDWRLGEQYFAARLTDYDLAANNGGWQWAASTGCDAQPWFRIFNPVTQSQRFDPAGRFIRRYVPELATVPDKYLHAPWTMTAVQQAACQCTLGKDYPAPIVDHATAREQALQLYAKEPR